MKNTITVIYYSSLTVKQTSVNNYLKLFPKGLKSMVLVRNYAMVSYVFREGVYKLGRRHLQALACCLIPVSCMLILSVVHREVRYCLTLLHSERPKLYTILAFLSAIGLMAFMDHHHSDDSSYYTEVIMLHIMYYKV